MSSGFALKRRLTLKNLSSVSSLVISAVFALLPGAVKSHAQLPVDVSSGKVLATGLNDPRGLVFGPDESALYCRSRYRRHHVHRRDLHPRASTRRPFKGGPSASIAKLGPTGTLTTLATGLPSFIALQGDIIGVADVAFLDGQLYALIGGGGCSHGNPDQPNGIVKVDRSSGKWNYITDLSTFYMEHPASYPDAGDFEPDGVPYSMIAHDGQLIAVEPNHGTITATCADGSTTEIIDVSFSEGHIVPTSIAANNNNVRRRSRSVPHHVTVGKGHHTFPGPRVQRYDARLHDRAIGCEELQDRQFPRGFYHHCQPEVSSGWPALCTGAFGHSRRIPEPR